MEWIKWSCRKRMSKNERIEKIHFFFGDQRGEVEAEKEEGGGYKRAV